MGGVVLASATHLFRPKEVGVKTKEEQLFDAQTAVQRCDKLKRILKAHDVPDDEVEGVVLFVEGINGHVCVVVLRGMASV